MCVQCTKERLPDRGNTCLDGGTYLLNYAGCVQCQKKTLLEETNIQREEDEDGEETLVQLKFQPFDTPQATPIIDFLPLTNVCQDCGHVVASHTYTFSHDEQYQEFSMVCNLCGHGEATVAVLPDDPWEQEM